MRGGFGGKRFGKRCVLGGLQVPQIPLGPSSTFWERDLLYYRGFSWAAGASVAEREPRVALTGNPCRLTASIWCG